MVTLKSSLNRWRTFRLIEMYADFESGCPLHYQGPENFFEGAGDIWPLSIANIHSFTFPKRFQKTPQLPFLNWDLYFLSVSFSSASYTNRRCPFFYIPGCILPRKSLLFFWLSPLPPDQCSPTYRKQLFSLPERLPMHIMFFSSWSLTFAYFLVSLCPSLTILGWLSVIIIFISDRVLG